MHWNRPNRRSSGADARSTLIWVLALTTACGSTAGQRNEWARRAPADTCLETRPAKTAEEPLATHADLEDYLVYAERNNAGLEAAFDDWAAARERGPQVSALPDPTLRYRAYVEEVETRVGPQEHAFGITQAFPWFGTLGARERAAAQGAQVARQRYEAKRLEVRAAVRSAYFEYYFLGRAVDVVRRTRNLVEYLEGVARNRYTTGGVGHSDVIRAQVELGQLDDRLRSLVDRRRPLAARLNASLNRPAYVEVPWPTAIRHESLRSPDEAVLADVAETNPELLALEHEVAAQKERIRIAEKGFYPGFSLGLDYIVTGEAEMSGVSDSGQDPVFVTLGIDLPVQRGKYRARLREARARLRSAIKRREERGRQLEAEAASTLYRLRDAERKIDLYQHALVPKARQSLAATETAFRGGEASFLDLVDAERLLLEFELAYERALADHGQHRADLERIVGRTLPFELVDDTGDVDQPPKR